LRAVPAQAFAMVKTTSEGKKKPVRRPVAIDVRSSQVRQGPRQIALESTSGISKGQFEKLPGTRVQTLKGGKVVRIIVEDGKQFDPSNVRAARKHIAKLREQAEELARIRGTPLPPSLSKETPKSAAKSAPGKSEDKSENKSGKSGTAAKKRKLAASVEGRTEHLEAKKQASAARRAAQHIREGRQLVSEELHTAEVVQRATGCAWARLTSKAEALPEALLQRFRASSDELREKEPACAAASALDMLLRLRFADVAEKDLQLEPGLSVKCKLYTDSSGIGGCEVCTG